MLQKQFAAILEKDFQEKDGSVYTKLHITRVGQNHDHRFSMTASQLVEMKKNFDGGVYRMWRDEKPIIPLNYGHAREAGQPAAGWIDALEISEDKQNLYGWAYLTPKAAQAVRDGEYQFVSAEWYLDYIDPETKKKYGTVLSGAALVIDPAVKDLERVYAMKEINTAAPTTITIDDVKAFVSTATADEKAQIVEACGGYMDMTSKETETEGTTSTDEKKDEAAPATTTASAQVNKQMQAQRQEIEKLKADNLRLVKEGQFQELLVAGKVVPSQKEAFIKGDIVAVLSIASAMNMSPKGFNSSEEINMEAVTLTEEEKKMAAKSNVTEEQALQWKKAGKLN